MQRRTSAAHVKAVLAIDDRVLRNYWVTQSYSDLAAKLTASARTGFGQLVHVRDVGILHGRPEPARRSTAGLAARPRDGCRRHDGRRAGSEPSGRAAANVERGFDDIVPDHVDDVLCDLFGGAPFDLSDGNTEVFAEIAPAAATFIANYGRASRDPDAARAAVLAACAGAPEFEGSNRLRDGFALWCDAIAEPDHTRRSQLVLAGSLQLGAHEQHHLQHAIAGSMAMGLDESLPRLKDRVFDDVPGLGGSRARSTTRYVPSRALSTTCGAGS